MTGLLGRAEPLLLELGDGTIGLHLGKRVVDGLGQRDVVGIHDDAVLGSPVGMTSRMVQSSYSCAML